MEHREKDTTLTFETPLAIALKPQSWNFHCHCCVAQKKDLKRCTGCKNVLYCGSECQKTDWADIHRLECTHLRTIPSIEQELEKRLNGRNNAAMAVLSLRLFLIDQESQLHSKEKSRFGRTFTDLVSHAQDIRKDSQRLTLFRLLLTTLQELFPALKNALVEGSAFFDTFCKVLINSHSLYNWTEQGECDPIALALCLDVSAFDHSCQPNAEIRSTGRATSVISLTADSVSPETTFIPYVNLMASTSSRKAFLRQHYYFACECKRCANTPDPMLNIRCPTCKLSTVLQSPCSHCSSDIPQKFVLKSETLMSEIEASVGDGIRAEENSLNNQELDNFAASAQVLLAPENIYFALLSNQLKTQSSSASTQKDHLIRYYYCLKRCYPHYSTRTFLSEAMDVVNALADITSQQGLAKTIFEKDVLPVVDFYFGTNRFPPFQDLLATLRQKFA